MPLWTPPFVTETDEPAWTDCTWASGLMLANKATSTAVKPKGRYPATRAEREALRAASGDRTGGSSLYDLRHGIAVRYDWTLSLTTVGWTTLMGRLKRGDGCVAQGLYSRLPEHYQRWDQAFAAKGPKSTHAVYVQGHDPAGYQKVGADGTLSHVWLMDPLARPGSTWKGEWLRASDLKAFCMGFGFISVATVRQGGVS